MSLKEEWAVVEITDDDRAKFKLVLEEIVKICPDTKTQNLFFHFIWKQWELVMRDKGLDTDEVFRK